MPPKSETPPLGEAGLANSSCVAADDREQTPNPKEKQAPFDRARMQLLARRLHQLGEAPLYHFLTDLDRGSDLRETLEIYASLPRDLVRAYRGHEFAPPFAIEGGAQ